MLAVETAAFYFVPLEPASQRTQEISALTYDFVNYILCIKGAPSNCPMVITDWRPQSLL